MTEKHAVFFLFFFSTWFLLTIYIVIDVVSINYYDSGCHCRLLRV